MTQNKTLPGKFTWYELVSNDAKKAQSFYGEVLGWKVQAFPMGNTTYEMIFAGETMIGGYSEAKHGQKPHWISYVSVDDVDAAAKLATANGGKIVDAPQEIPTVGRNARIADPSGAEICLFKSVNGDPPDTVATQGKFLWNELHTSDPKTLVGFYEKVVGFTHVERDMGPSGTYYMLMAGGTGRGGATNHGMEGGAPPHWLPYVMVDDCDQTLARARKLGGKTPFEAMDIPEVGRFGVILDPVGGLIAVMKPAPMPAK